MKLTATPVYVLYISYISTAANGFAPAFSRLSSSKPSKVVDQGRTHVSPALYMSATIDKNNKVAAKSETTVAAVPKLSQRWRKSTKQVATLGPASSNREMIEKLFLAGADVFRLNFSHGDQKQKKELLDIIRDVEEKYSHPIAALGDLQGPKLRVSLFNIILDLSHG